MNDRLQLGYQAEIVSLINQTYGRIGLSARQHHPFRIGYPRSRHHFALQDEHLLA